MRFTPEALYELLPAVHRDRDARIAAAAGLARGPLRELVDVLAGQAAVLEDEIEQLYDNHFVETASAWALPYLSELLGIRGLSSDVSRVRTPRGEVGHTVGYRRRKGTASMLEQLALDTTGWPARAVEFFERLATTQQMNHVRADAPAWGSLRRASHLEYVGTPFETETRTLEARRIEPGYGRWNIPNVGLFLWRLSACSLTRSPMSPALGTDRHYRFHPLGFDVPLFNLPATDDDPTHLAEPANMPSALTRRAVAGLPANTGRNDFHVSEDYYGSEQCIRVETRLANGELRTIPAAETLVADLRDDPATPGAWAHQDAGVATGAVLIDPVLGRIVLPQPAVNGEPPLGTFYGGLVSALGGGEYDRAKDTVRQGTVVAVSNQDPLAISTVADGLARLGTATGAVVVMDSGRYSESLDPIDATGRQVEVAAADGRRPTLELGQTLQLGGDAQSVVTLDGLLLAGKAIEIVGDLGLLVLRHCTLVPELVVGADGTITFGERTCLTVRSARTRVEIDHCIVRALRVADDVEVHVRNSIVDAGAPDGVAIAGLDDSKPAGTWRVENCTIIGKLACATLELASNTLFVAELGNAPGGWTAPVSVVRRQEGCVRFCWLPRGARVPRRHQCLPSAESPDVRPVFTSLRFGDPAYGQLGRSCPAAILCGADDESEIGAHHDMFQPQRLAYLRARVNEYLRFGLEAGLFTET